MSELTLSCERIDDPDAALAVEIGEALALLISGQVKTDDSIRIATSVGAAIEKGRDMAPMEIDGGNLSLNETLGGMGSCQ